MKDFDTPSTRITSTVRRFCEDNDLGKTKTYELIKSGDLESVRFGHRRLIVVDSYRRLIARKQAEQSAK